MNKETLRMQMLAGVITESQYKSRLNEISIPGVYINKDEDEITISGDSGDYSGFIEDDGTVEFSVVDEDEEFTDENWDEILGPDHVFTKISNSIPTKVEALGDYVQITVKVSDLI
jgi:hypothetical protein